MEDLMIKIDNVKKQYRLGAIGGGTLQGDLQTWWAKVRGKENPNSKIGAKVYKKNEKFMALDGVSFEVKTGERVGIIGHNGAGKSTLLKLLSRVTAPTEGQIYLNGRVASMLEVGTGFHGELTGRENIYMNGAILGMTKAEIDAKIEDIIEFSECGQFIDTPVKRYSSGMYVKLAFSVAAHLDSEIMIMDEVLAVGDMAFQKKCLEKMSQVSETEGRTILYVSHNMNTIRQLCDRVVVLDHGKVVFDGDVEEGIGIYMGKIGNPELNYCYSDDYHEDWSRKDFRIQELHIQGKETASFEVGEKINFVLKYATELQLDVLKFRFEITHKNGTKIGSAFSPDILDVVSKDGTVKLSLDTRELTPGKYKIDIVGYTSNEFGAELPFDGVYPGMIINIVDTVNKINKEIWQPQYWGYVRFNDVSIIE